MADMLQKIWFQFQKRRKYVGYTVSARVCDVIERRSIFGKIHIHH